MYRNDTLPFVRLLGGGETSENVVEFVVPVGFGVVGGMGGSGGGGWGLG